MLFAISLAGMAFALDPIPELKPKPGDCARSIPIEIGKPIPAALVDMNGRAKCSGIVEPPASFAYLLAVESRAETADRLFQLDVSILETERDWYRSELERERSRQWWQKPAAQRWFGRLEMLATVGVVVAGFGAAYNSGYGN